MVSVILYFSCDWIRNNRRDLIYLPATYSSAYYKNIFDYNQSYF